MPMVTMGRYRARVATCEADIRASQQLRFMAFAPATTESALDSDKFDGLFTHFLVEEAETGRLMCSFRMLLLPDGRAFSQSYSAQFYDLSALSGHEGPMVELGRFCIHPMEKDPDIIRAAWAAMTRFVDEYHVTFMFGCVSFAGNDAGLYGDAFALLRDKHVAPTQMTPLDKSTDICRFKDYAAQGAFDRRQALQQMPPLLRTYLAMGGRVSDHAVIDRHLNTLHVFIGLEVAAIPAARKEWLRALAPA